VAILAWRFILDTLVVAASAAALSSHP